MSTSGSQGDNRSRLIIRVDGAARGNPGPAGIGGIIQNAAGKILAEISEYIGETTNNIAEYFGLIHLLRKAADYQADELIIYSDSELLIRQLKGEYKVKSEGLKPLASEARVLLRDYSRLELVSVPREENSDADRLANKAIDDFLAGKKEIHKVIDLPEQGELF